MECSLTLGGAEGLDIFVQKCGDKLKYIVELTLVIYSRTNLGNI